MLACSCIVESSTYERRYYPARGKEARIVWLQRSGTVNDQTFESFAILPTEAQAVITTSQRRETAKAMHGANVSMFWRFSVVRHEVITFAGAFISVCGSVTQFVGLRGCTGQHPSRSSLPLPPWLL